MYISRAEVGRVGECSCNKHFDVCLTLRAAQKSSESISSKYFVISAQVFLCIHKTKSISSTGFPYPSRRMEKEKKWNRNNNKSKSKNNNTNRRNSFTHPQFVWLLLLPFFSYVQIHGYLRIFSRMKENVYPGRRRDGNNNNVNNDYCPWHSTEMRRTPRAFSMPPNLQCGAHNEMWKRREPAEAFLMISEAPASDVELASIESINNLIRDAKFEGGRKQK